MYYISGKSFNGKIYSELKKKYNLKYNNICLEIYCKSQINRSTDISGFIYLLNECDNINFLDLIKFLIDNQTNLANTHNILKIIQSKCNKNVFCT